METAYLGGEAPLIQVPSAEDEALAGSAAGQYNREPNSAGSDKTDAGSHRPRSRTTAPWRGRSREQGGIFARPTNSRLQVSRQSTVDGAGGAMFVSSGALAGTTVDEGGLSGATSAGLIAEKSSPATNDQQASGVSAHRRRGHTLEPDHLSALRAEHVDLGPGRVPQTATGSHFHVATQNTSLTGLPAWAIKKGSASSSATTSTVDIEGDPQAHHLHHHIQQQVQQHQQQQQQPQGQLARMLVNTIPDAIISTHASPEAPRNLAATQTIGMAGRAKRGGSTGESRLSDLKSVFGGRGRSSEQAYSGSPDDHAHGAHHHHHHHHHHYHNAGQHQQSVSVEMPSALASSGVDNAIEELGGRMALMSASTGDSSEPTHRTLSTHQQQQQQHMQKAAPRVTKAVSTVSQTDVEPHAPLARSSDGSPAGYAQAQAQAQAQTSHHQRRESMHGSVLGVSGRVTSGAEFVRSVYGSSGSRDNDAPQCPWRPRATQAAAQGTAARRTLKGRFEHKWSHLAAAPHAKPVCAAAGRNGLMLLGMGPDTISVHSNLSGVMRRWSLALDFKDVIWQPSDLIATGSNDGTVMIWDASRHSDPIMQRYTDVKRAVNRLAHKPDDPLFVYAAFSDVNLLGWDVRAHTSHASLRIEMPRAPQDISCNPLDPNVIAAISQEGQVSLWDIRKPTQFTRQFPAHAALNGRCLTWHPNGRFLASAASEHVIKIWDMGAASSKKFNVTPFCTIRTPALTMHRLRWRPGHDTQISSSAFSSDNCLQIWDMRNPNHSLMYHDLHNAPIGGFAWVDSDTVWSVARDATSPNESCVVQCNMQTDAIVTAGLLPETVAEFSPTCHLSVATGVISPHPERDTVPRFPTNASRGSKSQLPEDASMDAVALLHFRPNLPESFLDEHVLQPDDSARAASFCYLASRYRYDPNDFEKSCVNNYEAAMSIGMLQVAKFWQFLYSTFYNVKPLKSRHRRRKPASDKAAKEDITETMEETLKQTADVSHSVATSRASSAVFPSRSVMAGLANLGTQANSSDEEMFSRYNSARSPTTISEVSSSVSLTQLRTTKNAQPRYPSESSSGSKLERNFLSLSHTNLQQVAKAAQSSTSRRTSRLPSLMSRSSTKTHPGAPNDCLSEPATPASHAVSTMQQQQQQQTGTIGTMGLNSAATGAHSRLVKQALNGLPSSSSSSSRRVATKDGVILSDTARSLTPASAPMFLSAPSSFIATNPLNITMHKKCHSSESHPTNPPTDKPIEKPVGTKTSSSPEAKVMMRNVTNSELKLAVDSCAYYADRGDVQTAVTAALLLRNFIRISKWAVTEYWFVTYIDLLDHHKAFAQATEIILASPFASTKALLEGMHNTRLACTYCGVDLTFITDEGRGYSMCSECQKQMGTCVVCEMPSKGRFIWCRGCGHGGHAKHMVEWFGDNKDTECPSGCGHVCVPQLAAGME
ncbi:SEA (Seh1-associated) complex subunit [Coemansia sp. Benny D115]|nr:SEA (Seh1-associated) complex subunit [Coemansia sp. Benny D115]